MSMIHGWVFRAEVGVLTVSGLFFDRVVNVSSQMGDLQNVSPSLQTKFASPTLTIPDLTALMEKYIR